MSVDEFLSWAEMQDGSFELERGFPVAKSPERVGHLEAKSRVWQALDAACRRLDAPFHALPDGATVRLNTETAYEPDALVYPGPRLRASAVEVPNPVIVVEILSPSTAYRDLGRKARNYFRVSSIAHYVIVDADDRVVTHKWRGEGEVVLSKDHAEGELALTPPGLVVNVADLLPPAEEPTA